MRRTQHAIALAALHAHQSLSFEHGTVRIPAQKDSRGLEQRRSRRVRRAFRCVARPNIRCVGRAKRFFRSPWPDGVKAVVKAAANLDIFSIEIRTRDDRLARTAGICPAVGVEDEADLVEAVRALWDSFRAVARAGEAIGIENLRSRRGRLPGQENRGQ